LIKLTSWYAGDNEVIRDLSLLNFLSLLTLRLLSKPTVSSRICTFLLCLLCKMRSCLKVSPLIKLGDGNEDRSAYIDQSVKCERLFERQKRTESCLQLYLPWSRYCLQPDTLCCKVSLCRQREQDSDSERNQLWGFFLVARVLFRYLTVKLNISLGKLCWTLENLKLVLKSEYFRIDETTKPFDNNSSFILSSCFVWMAFSAYLLFLYCFFPEMSDIAVRWRLQFLPNVFWHCMNLIKVSTRLVPYFDLLIIELLKVALIESSSYCPISLTLATLHKSSHYQFSIVNKF